MKLVYTQSLSLLPVRLRNGWNTDGKYERLRFERIVDFTLHAFDCEGTAGQIGVACVKESPEDGNAGVGFYIHRFHDKGVSLLRLFCLMEAFEGVREKAVETVAFRRLES